MRTKRAWYVLGVVIAPLLLGLFFAVAPAWRQSKIVEEIQNSDLPAEARDQLARLHYPTVCATNSPSYLADALRKEGTCAQFSRFRAAKIAGFTLAGASALFLLLLLRAKPSATATQREIARRYHSVLGVTHALALAKTAIEFTLLTYFTFELTALWTNTWYPKVVGAAGLLGLLANAKLLKTIFSKSATPTTDRFAAELTPTHAPELWAAVQTQAKRIGAAAPDHVLVTPNNAFCITDSTVVHANGRTRGRALLLSKPLLDCLTTDEVAILLTHELAHINGDEAVLSSVWLASVERFRQVYVTLKTSGVLTAAPLYGYASVALAGATQTISAQREATADATMAKHAAPRAAAAALVRLHQLALAHDAKMQALLKNQPLIDWRIDSNTPLDEVSNYLVTNRPSYWQHLGAYQMPHPRDAHASLASRLASFGCGADEAALRDLAPQHLGLRTLAEAAVAPAPSAGNVWLAAAHAVISHQQAAHEVAVRDISQRDQLQLALRQADPTTEAGRALLNQHFPETRFKHRQATLVISFGVGVVTMVGLAALVALLASKPRVPVAITLLIAVALALLTRVMWRMWKRGFSRTLRVSATEIQASHWPAPLPFSDIANISAVNTNGQLVVTLKFVAPRQLPERPFFFNRPRKAMNLGVQGYNLDGPNLYALLARYIQRQLP